MVVEGLVRVGGTVARKPSMPVEASSEVVVEVSGPRWVGRGALKLVAALETWGAEGLTVAGRRCVDVGASTGGFTQVLLDAGAERVVAVDVGRDQLVPELANDPRVEDRPGTTVRGLTADELGGTADVVVADLSFISLTLVAADLAGLVRPGGDLVVLVKPQFEVGRAGLGRGGVVTDPARRAAALTAVVASFAAVGLHVHGLATSPVTGTTGNVEYLLWARSVPSDTMTDDDVRAAVRALTDDARGG